MDRTYCRDMGWQAIEALERTAGNFAALAWQVTDQRPAARFRVAAARARADAARPRARLTHADPW